jgi:hypothetical protein
VLKFPFLFWSNKAARHLLISSIAPRMKGLVL